MFDLKLIRRDARPFREAWNAREVGLGDAHAAEIERLDGIVRSETGRRQDAEARRKAASKEAGAARGQGDMDRFEALRAETTALKEVIEDASSKEGEAALALSDLLMALPNLPMDDVPEGPDESANVVVSSWGEPGAFAFEPRDHVELGELCGGMDFETAARMSGARFALLKGPLARLERAIAAFMLELQTEEHGYTEVSPPLLVKPEALRGTGQLPKFEDDQFATDRAADGEPGHYLIPTSEVPLTNMVRESILEPGTLPLRYAARTPCFRSEAGSAGRDTRGLIRLHQFEKVELVSIVAGEKEGLEELERKTRCAETVLERLELPYRRVLLCTGDMGFAARKTFDLEVWLPSQHTYREISSCSYCGDFQARRMAARHRPEPDAKPSFVHTLNGSGLAVGRALVAVLENYQDEDGSVRIPAALKSHMGGADRIPAVAAGAAAGAA